ncbi:helix-turn-helix domain-containing protein [Caproiciproducens sp. R2]|uniref:helix-turn-helix domain-containing protein n=1 Tax=Caproiciproducens sp. R2 TaxID=3435187 RepID=UPI0040336444
MGTTKLKCCFKSYFDCTVADYIQRVRIDQAEHLLAYTDLPVGEVAKAVGYTAAGHFAELFRSAKGILPLEYRKAMWERQGTTPPYIKIMK